MRTGVLLLLSVILSVTTSFASAAKTCPGSAAVGKLNIFVEPPKSGPALPIESVNAIDSGDRIEYDPASSGSQTDKKARVAVVLVPANGASSAHWLVLKEAPADSKAEWKVPFRVSVVGLVLGPDGLSVKKVSSFVEKNPELMPQFADYAERTTTIEALVHTLSEYEQSKPGTTSLQSTLNSFSSKYGVTLPALGSNQSTTAQASALLNALLPAVSSTAPLTSSETLLKGSTGLAASVATMFFGSPVGLAAGGAVLFESLRTSLFPRTDFQPAFAEPSDSKELTLCSNSTKAKAGTRLAYLWVERVPDASAPVVTLVGAEERLPLAWKSRVKVSTASVGQLKLVSRARDWELVSGKQSVAVPVTVKVEPADDELTIDLRHVKLGAGEYHLAAKWDWAPLPVTGTLDLVQFPDLSKAALTPDSEDRLVEGSGAPEVRVTGGDFEFVDWAGIVSAADPTASPTELTFQLVGTAGKPNSLTMKVDCDLWKAGKYILRLKQRNGATQDVAVAIHPPNPALSKLPLRVNLGAREQHVVLEGAGLGRIDRMTSGDATWTLDAIPAGAGNVDKRQATIALGANASEGERIAASMYVAGLHKPIEVSDAIQVIGPLPEIVSVRKSGTAAGDVELMKGEIPADTAVSFLIAVKHAGTQPSLALGCGDDSGGEPKLLLAPGARKESAEFDVAGQDSFFLSLDPGRVSASGCLLTAAVENPETGASVAYPLGRIVLLPRIEKFRLSDKKEGRHLYVGTLTGRNLQRIAKTGWNGKDGYEVLGIPTPVAGNPEEQTLEIAMPWPPPSPQAPLYIWLEGEGDGRRTAATYGSGGQP
ncbi:MAG: hypothetical protein KGL59_11025 [Acidobacteriota bacterium]|nr:hypothetical protein [Acidobacteriota bacterium]